MLDDPFLTASTSAGLSAARGSRPSSSSTISTTTSSAASAAAARSFLLGAGTTSRGKENALIAGGGGGGLAPSPRLHLSSSSSAGGAGGKSAVPPRLKRRVTFSPTPLPSLHASPRHKRAFVLVQQQQHDDEEEEEGDGDAQRDVKRRRGLLAFDGSAHRAGRETAARASAFAHAGGAAVPLSRRNVYSNNPLLFAARLGSTPPSDASTDSAFSASAAGLSTPPLLSFSSSSNATAFPFASTAGAASQLPGSPPLRPSSVRISCAEVRSPPRPPTFRPAPVLPPQQRHEAGEEADVTDSETESEVVSSLLLPPPSSVSAAAAAAAGATVSPLVSLPPLSSSSPLPSPSFAGRARPPQQQQQQQHGLRSILKPRRAALTPHLASFSSSPSTVSASSSSSSSPLALALPSEKEATKRNSRGRRHAASWEGEKKALKAALAMREAAAGAAQGQAGGRPQQQQQGGGEGAGAAARGSRGRTAARGAGGSRAGAGQGGRGGDDEEDQQRRRRLGAGTSNGAASSGVGGAAGAGDGRRIVHDLEFDDPVHLRSPLLTLKASLRTGAAVPPVPLGGYDGAAPSLPPRQHPDAPPLDDGAASRRFFAAPTLLTDVEEAYVLLTHALFRLPADLPNPERTFLPLRQLGTALVRALTRDLSNVASFPQWVAAQPAPAPSPPRTASHADDTADLALSPSPRPRVPADGAGKGKEAKRSLTEEQMRRLRDEMAVAQAAVKCAAALCRDERAAALFDDETLVSLVRLVASLSLAPNLSTLVQQNFLLFVPFFLSSQRLPPSLLAPLMASEVLPSLRATLTLPPRIDRSRLSLGESLMALSSFLPHADLAREMLDRAEARDAWFRPAMLGLWDGPKRGTSMRERVVKLVGRVVRALTMPLPEVEGEDEAKERTRWVLRREQIMEELGADFQSLLNSPPPDGPVDERDPERKLTYVNLLDTQLETSVAVVTAATTDAMALSTGFGVVSLLAVLPGLMGSSFRKFQDATKSGGQTGFAPWLRAYNTLSNQSAPQVQAISALAWSHVVYNFARTVSDKAGVPSWLFRLPDYRPLRVLRSLFETRQEIWTGSGKESRQERSKAEAGHEAARAAHAKALTLALVACIYGVTVHIQHGSSAARSPIAAIDPPPTPTARGQYDLVLKHFLDPYLPLMTAGPTVSSQVSVLAWSLLSSVLRPRSALDNSATLEVLLNLAFLDGSLGLLPPEKHAVFTAAALERAVQPTQVPGWSSDWITDRIDKVLSLVEKCLPTEEPAACIQDEILNTWQNLLRTLTSSPASLRKALAWLAKLSAPTSKHAETAAKLWVATMARKEDAVVQAVERVVRRDVHVVSVACRAWLALHEKPTAYAGVLARSFTSALLSASIEHVTTTQLEACIGLMRVYLDSPSTVPEPFDSDWLALARAVDIVVCASQTLYHHLMSIVSDPNDDSADLLLVILLVAGSHNLGSKVHAEACRLSEHAVREILINEYASDENILLIARLLRSASDDAFPTIYDDALRQLSTVVQPISDHLRRFAPVLYPSLNRALQLSEWGHNPESQAMLEASLAQHTPQLAVHGPIVAFETFWRATFARSPVNLEYPPEMVDPLRIVMGVAPSLNVPGLAETQEVSQDGAISAPPAGHAPTHSRPHPRTSATATADLTGRGYDADQSHLPSNLPSADDEGNSTFTGLVRNAARAPSPSLYGATLPPQLDDSTSGERESSGSKVATGETQVVEETPKEVHAMRARASLAALASEAKERDEARESEERREAAGTGKRRRDASVDEAFADADSEDEEGQETIAKAAPQTKKPSPPPRKKAKDSETRHNFDLVIPQSTSSRAGPSLPKKRAGGDEQQEQPGAKKKRKGASTRSKAKDRVGNGSTSPPPAVESSRAESNRVVPQTPEAEDTVRRFFALPLDTVVEVGKRLGGSPSLKRLMDLGERARPFAKWINENQDALVARLKEAVEIPSVSGDASYRPHVHRMGAWLKDELVKLGAEIQSIPMGPQNLDGQEVELPPVLIGSLGKDPKKKTILVYGHYDVQPALLSDGWKYEPFQFTHDKETNRLYGRGSSDDKGPILGWLNVIEAHQKTGTELPVNMKFCFEGMEESGSEGLEELVIKEAKGEFADVDAVCISDNYWLGTTTPCLTYGLRGLSYFSVSISGPAADLHSGVFGAVVHEPMTDLFAIFSKLVSPQGKILVPGINEKVAPLTDEERKLYEVIDVTVQDFEAAIGGKVTISEDKAEALMARMRYPSLSIHGIEGAFSAPGAKTVIPAAVKGKFSIRLVPDLDPDEVGELVTKYLQDEFAKLGSKNTLKVEMLHGGKPWVASIDHWNFRAAKKATETVYGKTPDFTREGGSIPITLTFAEALGKNVMLLPMGRGDDGAHSTNEKLDLDNFIRGSVTLGEYLHEVPAAAAAA
ncbi:metallodipeptidase [Rhodotorula paludigena]|uniref:metallodipeptidase n=1 Tax=Rhodotorula paludigena TaxID=86838 RepID=UPI0031812835